MLRLGMDRAPYPADWALSRIIYWPASSPEQQEGWVQERSRRLADQRLTLDMNKANLEMSFHFDGLCQVPHMYHMLFHRSRTFVANVEEIVATTIKHAPSRWAEAASLIVDYSVNVLRSEKLGFEKFLNSQRKSIYWILDEALLRICLDQWEDRRPNVSWDRVTKPINLALTSAHEELPGWAELDLKEFLKTHAEWDGIASTKPLIAGYFERTSAFLRESARVYEIWRTVRRSGIGQLPNELADVIIQDVFEFEKLPMADLRPMYLSKGKGKA